LPERGGNRLPSLIPALDRWRTCDVSEALMHARQRATGTGPTSEIGRPLLLVLDDLAPLEENPRSWLIDIWQHGPRHGVRLALAVPLLSGLPEAIHPSLRTAAVVVQLPDRRGAHVPAREA